MIEFHYNQTKTLEAISYILSKTEKKEMEILRLIKILYFADRECIKEYNLPITGDNFSSLPLGPIVSKTFNSIKSKTNTRDMFTDHIERVDRSIRLVKNVEIRKLSEAEIEILDEIFDKFIHYSIAQLIDYCHNPVFVPEWRDPGSSSIPIDVEDLLIYLNKSKDEIKFIKDAINEHNAITQHLAKYAT